MGAIFVCQPFAFAQEHDVGAIYQQAEGRTQCAAPDPDSDVLLPAGQGRAGVPANPACPSAGRETPSQSSAGAVGSTAPSPSAKAALPLRRTARTPGRGGEPSQLRTPQPPGLLLGLSVRRAVTGEFMLSLFYSQLSDVRPARAKS